MDIVGIAALAGDQGLVFETPNGLANAEFHDRSSIKMPRFRFLKRSLPGKMGFGIGSR